MALIKSNMSNLPIYFMSIYKMPTAVANQIEKIQRQFLWGDSKEKKRLHLVKWDKVTKHRRFGGLGIKKLLEHNEALLAKWWWRFSREKDALWVKVVSRKYDLGEEVWLPQVPNRGKGFKCLARTYAMWETLVQIWENVSFRVSNLKLILAIALNFGTTDGLGRKL